jgi:hypothetical protein
VAVDSAIALASLEAVKTFLRIGEASLTAEETAELERQINDASAWFASRCGRDFLRREYVDQVDGRGGSVLYLAGAPVSEVTSVTVDGVEIPAAASEVESGWQLVGEDQLVLNGYRFTAGTRNVVVRYLAGWPVEEIPADLAGAVLQLVALRWKEGGRGGAVTQSVAGGSASWAGAPTFANISSVADAYRRRSL